MQYILLMILVMVGCEAGVSKLQDTDGTKVEAHSKGATAQSIVMPDGTRCVTLVAGSDVAIHCDWSETQ